MNNHKPFERELYNNFDTKARKLCCEFLLATGRFVLDTPLENQLEKFKERDFVIRYLPLERQVNVECEVKTLWTKSGCWQNPKWDIHIPYRKAQSKADYFFIVNNAFDTLCFISAKVLKKSKVIEKNTRNKVTGTATYKEKFFEVKLEDCYFYYKQSDGWVKRQYKKET